MKAWAEAFGYVGVALVLIWGVYSCRKEDYRHQEAMKTIEVQQAQSEVKKEGDRK